jgi:hypothetical protein
MNARILLLMSFELCSAVLGAAEVRLLLPLGRTVYQCNESVPLTVLWLGAQAQSGGELLLRLTATDDSCLTFTFPAAKSEARSVAHLSVNGWLLRPGSYSVKVSCAGATAQTNITLHSHIRRSDFKLINWGRAKGKDQLAQAEEGLGFNLFYGQGDDNKDASLILAGVDFMSCCTMGGGHQMDLRQECDWSDPYVIHGGTRRVARRAFMDRTQPNVLGVHFYDEPGLTWAKDPETGEMSPHVVPWQQRSYQAAFGQPPLDWKRIDPANPEQAARWAQWARWKLGFMDAAWKDAKLGVSTVEPAFASGTQSQYGYSAFCDGYYFNVVRSLPITSGHGGYHDFGPGYFNPSMFLEFARAHDLAKPNWYLPTWYGNTTADEFRLEQYLSFQCGLQGMISPPDIDPGGTPEKSAAAQGVVESNHLLQRLGPIFNTMPPTRPPVALLYSLSQFIHTQTLDRKVCYAHDTEHGRNVVFAYLAGKLLQEQFLPVLDEDILDGTLAAEHRAVILTSIDYLDPEVIRGLEHFAATGGLVLLTADSSVSIKGAAKLAVAPAWPDAEKVAELKKAGKSNEANELMRLRQALAGAKKLADAIRPRLNAAGIEPPLTSSEPGIVVTRHSAGDVEYLFAVNATHDPEGSPMLGIKPVTTKLKFPDDGRTVYDAIRGKLERPSGGVFTFGPGQMRVFARTRGVIQGVKIGRPDLRRDYTLAQSPLHLEFAASVLTGENGVLSGSIPLRILVVDSLGAVRYDLYRATERGTFNFSLPLALNDPPGEWKLSLTEQLSGATGEKRFVLPATPTCPAAAGEVPRAVHWPADRERIFSLFRTHQHVTLVTGSSAYNSSAAERLEKLLGPWNIRCVTMKAAEANNARSLNPDEARTWVGLDFAGHDQIKPDASNPLAQSGFAVHGPVILLGTPADNPLVKFVADQRFLPYQPDAESMPGPGRGYVAWQREAIGVNQESISLIAYDAAGMSEAVGTLYEMLAGLEALTPLARAQAGVVLPAAKSNAAPELTVAWQLFLEDRVTGLRSTEGKLTALTAAHTLTEVSPEGAVLASAASPADYAALAQQFKPGGPDAIELARKLAPAGCLPKVVADDGTRRAVAYWGGRLEVYNQSGQPIASHHGPQDITAAAWVGPRLVVGDADGRIKALTLPPKLPHD